MPSHAHDHRPVERGIGLPVAASIQSMPVGLARGGGNRTRAAQLGECCLGADTTGVITGGDEELGSGVETDPEGFNQLWRSDPGALLKVASVDLDLLVQLEPAARERSGGMTGSCGWVAG